MQTEASPLSPRTHTHKIWPNHFGLSQIPPNYPEEYFARFALPADVLSMVIGRLRTDDIYKQMICYPNPSQRSTGDLDCLASLATQADRLSISSSVLETANLAIRNRVCEGPDSPVADTWQTSTLSSNKHGAWTVRPMKHLTVLKHGGRMEDGRITFAPPWASGTDRDTGHFL